MTQILKNKLFAGAFIAAFAVLISFATPASALTTSADSDTVLNPPALSILPEGCDLNIGTVYSPLTGQSCSVNGVTITPPIVMMPPYDANGCGGGPYSITTGITCPGMTPTSVTTTSTGCATGSVYNTTTGKKCATITTSTNVSTGYDCMTAKNAYCAGTTTTSSPVAPVNGVCADGTVKVYSTTTGKLSHCAGSTTTPPTWLPPVKVTSTSDVRGIQNALNHVLGANLSVALTADGKKGPRTVAAIKLFQKWAGITADGKVGPITLGKLNASIK